MALCSSIIDVHDSWELLLGGDRLWGVLAVGIRIEVEWNKLRNWRLSLDHSIINWAKSSLLDGKCGHLFVALNLFDLLLVIGLKLVLGNNLVLHMRWLLIHWCLWRWFWKAGTYLVAVLRVDFCQLVAMILSLVPSLKSFKTARHRVIRLRFMDLRSSGRLMLPRTQALNWLERTWRFLSVLLGDSCKVISAGCFWWLNFKRNACKVSFLLEFLAHNQLIF